MRSETEEMQAYYDDGSVDCENTHSGSFIYGILNGPETKYLLS